MACLSNSILAPRSQKSPIQGVRPPKRPSLSTSLSLFGLDIVDLISMEPIRISYRTRGLGAERAAAKRAAVRSRARCHDAGVLSNLLSHALCRHLTELFEISPTIDGAARHDDAGDSEWHRAMRDALLGRCAPEIAKAFKIILRTPRERTKHQQK